MFPPFADLRWVTALSECGHDLAAIAAGKDPGCDPYGRQGGLGYPAFSVYAARALGLGLRQTGMVAFGFGLTLVLLLVAQLRCLFRSGWIRDLLLSLLLLGLPLQIALERANIDIIIFIIITALCALLALSGRWALTFVGLFSFLPVACKVYPVVGLWAWVVQDWLRWRRLRPKALMVLVGASLGMLSALSWLLHYGSKAPYPGEGVLAHGFMTSTLFKISQQLSHQWANWPAPLNAVLLIAIKIAVITMSFLVAFNHNFSGLWREFLASRCQAYSRNFLEIYIVLTTAVWLGCYLFSLCCFVCYVGRTPTKTKHKQHKTQRKHATTTTPEKRFLLVSFVCFVVLLFCSCVCFVSDRVKSRLRGPRRHTILLEIFGLQIYISKKNSTKKLKNYIYKFNFQKKLKNVFKK
jgi:hypothetical protein